MKLNITILQVKYGKTLYLSAMVNLAPLVYDNVDTETVQLNKHTPWSGNPNRNDNPLAFDSLALIRQLVFAGGQKEANMEWKDGNQLKLLSNIGNNLRL